MQPSFPQILSLPTTNMAPAASTIKHCVNANNATATRALDSGTACLVTSSQGALRLSMLRFRGIGALKAETGVALNKNGGARLQLFCMFGRLLTLSNAVV